MIKGNCFQKKITKQEPLVCVLIGCIIFFISLIISSFYRNGDQAGYHAAYELVGGLDWSRGHQVYETLISGEGVHYLVCLIGSSLSIDKNLFMSLFNGILAAYATRLLNRWGASLWFAALIVLTNYYFYVLYFAAERLKFAFLFLILALLSSKSAIYFYFFSFAAIRSHSSMLLIYCGLILTRLHYIYLNFRRGWSNELALFLIMTAIMLGLMVWDSKYLFMKLNTYIKITEPFEIINLIPVAGLLFFSCIYAKRIIEPFLCFLPIIMSIFLIGGSRLNMMAYFVFLYFGLKKNSGLNIGVLTTTLYFTFKSFYFLYNVIKFGTGFP